MSNRWWIYQKERFPILQNSLLSLLLGTSAVGYSLLLRQPSALLTPQALGAMVLASLVTLLFLLQQQVMDEFRELPVDVLQHPNRAVSQGVISLQSLQILGLAAGLIQFGLALPSGLGMVLLLSGVWGYLLLSSGSLSRNLRVFRFTKSQGWIKRLMRAAGWAFLTLYATAQDWLAAKAQLSVAIGWLLLVSFGLGLVFELSRSLSAGTVWKTNSLARPAILRWLIGVWLLTLVALQASVAIQFVVPVTLIALGLLLFSSLAAVWFWLRPTRSALNLLRLNTALWAMAVYLNLGILPLLMRQ